jgi:hypothetical protein
MAPVFGGGGISQCSTNRVEDVRRVSATSSSDRLRLHRQPRRRARPMAALQSGLAEGRLSLPDQLGLEELTAILNSEQPKVLIHGLCRAARQMRSEGSSSGLVAAYLEASPKAAEVQSLWDCSLRTENHGVGAAILGFLAALVQARAMEQSPEVARWLLKQCVPEIVGMVRCVPEGDGEYLAAIMSLSLMLEIARAGGWPARELLALLPFDNKYFGKLLTSLQARKVLPLGELLSVPPHGCCQIGMEMVEALLGSPDYLLQLRTAQSPGLLPLLASQPIADHDPLIALLIIRIFVQHILLNGRLPRRVRAVAFEGGAAEQLVLAAHSAASEDVREAALEALHLLVADGRVSPWLREGTSGGLNHVLRTLCRFGLAEGHAGREPLRNLLEVGLLASPSLVVPYMRSLGGSSGILDPRPDSACLKAYRFVAWLVETAPLPTKVDLVHGDDPQHLLGWVMPAALGKRELTKAVLHANILVCCAGTAVTHAVLERVGRMSSPGDAIRDTVRHRLPEIQTLLSMRGRLGGSIDASTTASADEDAGFDGIVDIAQSAGENFAVKARVMVWRRLLSLLRAYQATLPEAVYAANFDFSKLLPPLPAFLAAPVVLQQELLHLLSEADPRRVTWMRSSRSSESPSSALEIVLSVMTDTPHPMVKVVAESAVQCALVGSGALKTPDEAGVWALSIEGSEDAAALTQIVSKVASDPLQFSIRGGELAELGLSKWFPDHELTSWDEEFSPLIVGALIAIAGEDEVKIGEEHLRRLQLLAPGAILQCLYLREDPLPMAAMVLSLLDRNVDGGSECPATGILVQSISLAFGLGHLGTTKSRPEQLALTTMPKSQALALSLPRLFSQVSASLIEREICKLYDMIDDLPPSIVPQLCCQVCSHLRLFWLRNPGSVNLPLNLGVLISTLELLARIVGKDGLEISQMKRASLSILGNGFLLSLLEFSDPRVSSAVASSLSSILLRIELGQESKAPAFAVGFLEGLCKAVAASLSSGDTPSGMHESLVQCLCMCSPWLGLVLVAFLEKLEKCSLKHEEEEILLQLLQDIPLPLRVSGAVEVPSMESALASKFLTSGSALAHICCVQIMAHGDGEDLVYCHLMKTLVGGGLAPVAQVTFAMSLPGIAKSRGSLPPSTWPALETLLCAVSNEWLVSACPGAALCLQSSAGRIFAAELACEGEVMGQLSLLRRILQLACVDPDVVMSLREVFVSSLTSNAARVTSHSLAARQLMFNWLMDVESDGESRSALLEAFMPYLLSIAAAALKRPKIESATGPAGETSSRALSFIAEIAAIPGAGHCMLQDGSAATANKFCTAVMKYRLDEADALSALRAVLSALHVAGHSQAQGLLSVDDMYQRLVGHSGFLRVLTGADEEAAEMPADAQTSLVQDPSCELLRLLIFLLGCGATPLPAVLRPLSSCYHASLREKDKLILRMMWLHAQGDHNVLASQVAFGASALVDAAALKSESGGEANALSLLMKSITAKRVRISLEVFPVDRPLYPSRMEFELPGDDGDMDVTEEMDLGEDAHVIRGDDITGQEKARDSEEADARDETKAEESSQSGEDTSGDSDSDDSSHPRGISTSDLEIAAVKQADDRLLKSAYDPSFILPILYAALQQREISAKVLCDSGVLGLCIMGTSSLMCSMRQIAYACLQLVRNKCHLICVFANSPACLFLTSLSSSIPFLQAVEQMTKREVARERQQALLILEYIRDGMDKSPCRLPCVTALYLGRAVDLLCSRPAHPAYAPVSSAFLRNPFLRLPGMPAVLLLFGPPSQAGSVPLPPRARSWTVKCLVQGLRTSEDLAIITRSRAIPLLLPLIDLPTVSGDVYVGGDADGHLQNLMLDLLDAVAALRNRGVRHLVLGIGLVSWIRSALGSAAFGPAATARLLRLLLVLLESEEPLPELLVEELHSMGPELASCGAEHAKIAVKRRGRGVSESSGTVEAALELLFALQTRHGALSLPLTPVLATVDAICASPARVGSTPSAAERILLKLVCSPGAVRRAGADASGIACLLRWLFGCCATWAADQCENFICLMGESVVEDDVRNSLVSEGGKVYLVDLLQMGLHATGGSCAVALRASVLLLGALGGENWATKVAGALQAEETFLSEGSEQSVAHFWSCRTACALLLASLVNPSFTNADAARLIESADEAASGLEGQNSLIFLELMEALAGTVTPPSAKKKLRRHEKGKEQTPKRRKKSSHRLLS